MTSAPSPASEPGFDPDALRRRYRDERDKRVRADGNDQYLEIAGEWADYGSDPYSEPVERAAVNDEVEVVIVGAGFGGLLAGARFRERGIDDVRLIEKGGDVGGTWYWNRYPGAQCDVESYVYLPLLEELGYVPTEKYSHGPEILDHSRRIARTYGLADSACLQTEVTGCEWDESAGRWTVRTNRGDAMRARFVVISGGPLHRPKLPGIAGLSTFKGHSFHTSRWDYAYTGGDSNGNLSGLSAKRVGIIGTGATSVQCFAHVARSAEHVYLFQRTPSSVDRRDNRPTDPGWAASLDAGWQRRRMENFNTLTAGGYAEEDLVADGWTDLIGKLIFQIRNDPETAADRHALAEAMEMADFEKMEEIRARVEEIVADPRTASALKPYYRQFCKRPCFHDDYLATFNRPNVSLVDTDGRGVERITERGVVVDSVEYHLDCLVFATGFEVGTDYTRRCGFDPAGRDDRRLSQHWADGMRTLHGMFAHGFPNLFIMGHAQAAFTANYPHLLDEQARHLSYVISQLRGDGFSTVEATPDAEEAWVQTIVRKARRARSFFEECTPGYYNNEGRPSERRGQDGPYGDGPVAYFELLERWRNAGILAGLHVSRPEPERAVEQ